MSIQYGAIVPVPHLSLVKGRKFHLILAHMVQQNDRYRDFYKQEARDGATIILDNSSYELGDAWATPEDLVRIYESLESKNVYLMCPEVAFKGEETEIAVKDFTSHLKEGILTFGTIHGTSYDEICQCYYKVSNLVDYVGFSYRIWCEDLAVPYPNKTVGRALMRISLLKRLFENNLILEKKPHHLLGLSEPQELVVQSKYSWIKSCDSSTAFIHGKNKVIFRERGLEGTERLEERLNFDETVENPNLVEIIKHNIRRVDLYGTGKVTDV